MKPKFVRSNMPTKRNIMFVYISILSNAHKNKKFAYINSRIAIFHCPAVHKLSFWPNAAEKLSRPRYSSVNGKVKWTIAVRKLDYFLSNAFIRKLLLDFVCLFGMQFAVESHILTNNKHTVKV